MPSAQADPGNPPPTLPVETLRDWYVTVSGGWSRELQLHQIRINREAIERNASLDPGTDLVRVTVLGGTRRPVFLDRFFEVVPLDARHPDALRHSPTGEAVFPDGDEVLRGARAARPGDPVLINNVGRRLDRLPSPDEFARILDEVSRRDRLAGDREA